MDAARRGVAVKGHILFTTTFPCHECARHIVAAGIEEVYFITPYPKSYAKELHLDAIYLDGKRADEKQVEFRTFVGISPRRYMEFFQLGERKRKENGKAVVWNPSKAQFRFPSLPAAYIRNEKDELKDLDDLMKAKGLEVVPEEPAA
jgi:hypothetical protein